MAKSSVYQEESSVDSASLFVSTMKSKLTEKASVFQEESSADSASLFISKVYLAAINAQYPNTLSICRELV